MQLKLGIMTLAELAEWFGISHNTIRHTKEKRLKLLKEFADYHMEGRSVCIDAIHIPEYNKAYDVIKEELPNEWNKSGLDTCARVGSALYWKRQDVKASIKEATAKSYANRAKIALYGKNNSGEVGELGFSNYEWCRRVGYDCQPLDAEQHAIIKECSNATFGKMYGEHAAILTAALKNQEITEAEYEASIASIPLAKRLECYDEFEAMVIEKLGFMPDRATRVTNLVDINGAF